MTTLRMLAAALLIVAAACGGDDGGAAGPRPSSTATIDIVSPDVGAVVPGPELLVELALEGGTIVERASKDLSPDKGHVHLKLDGRIVSQTFALSERITVEPGRHLLEAEFVAADHSPFDPRVLDTVTFTVE